MSRKSALIIDIIDKEWDMFTKVNNIGGKTACQEDFATFFVSRMSQSESWSEPALRSYLNDLEIAEQNGKNLLSEKYARMMASTSPDYYRRIVHLLPPLDEKTVQIVEKIVQIVLGWETDLADQYPYIIQKGRPLFSSQDTQAVTSG